MPFTYDETGALLVSGPIGGSGAATRVAFWTAAHTLGSSANLYWDNVTNNLGINTAAPYVNAALDVVGRIQASNHIWTQTRFYAMGVGNAPFDADSESVFLRHTGTAGELYTTKSGTGANRPIAILPGGTVALYCLTSGNVGVAETAPDRRLHAVDDDGDGSVIVPVARIESQVSGGAGAAGHGPGFEYYGESSTTENTFMAEIAARWSVATHASRRSRIEMYAAYQANEVLCGVIEAPANASVDGNSRGVGAVDLQSYRTAASQVAFGNYSALVAGQRNEIGGAIGSVAIGGYDHSIGGGADQAGVVAGYDHLVDGAAYAGIIGGREALLNNYGQITRASGMFSSQGDAQSSDYVARLDQASHAVNTWYPLYLDGASEQMTIQPSTAWTFEALIVGLTANAAQQWGYRIVGLIERDNAGNTTMAASTTTTIFESDANYDAQAVADNVNEALDIEVRRTGGVDYSIQWVATIRIAESTH